MINNSQIVEETRQVRYLISLKFDQDINRYMKYLQTKESQSKEKNLHDNHLQCKTSKSGNHQQEIES